MATFAHYNSQPKAFLFILQMSSCLLSGIGLETLLARDSFAHYLPESFNFVSVVTALTTVGFVSVAASVVGLWAVCRDNRRWLLVVR